MAEFVRIRNVHTGAIASLPESVLQNLPDWVVDPGPPPEKPKPKKNIHAVPAASSEKE